MQCGKYKLQTSHSGLVVSKGKTAPQIKQNCLIASLCACLFSVSLVTVRPNAAQSAMQPSERRASQTWQINSDLINIIILTCGRHSAVFPSWPWDQTDPSKAAMLYCFTDPAGQSVFKVQPPHVENITHWLNTERADSTGPHLNPSAWSQRPKYSLGRAPPKENISFLKCSWLQTASETTSCRRRTRVSGYAGSLAGPAAGGREDKRMTVMYCLWLKREYNSGERGGTSIWCWSARSDWRDTTAGWKTQTLKAGVSKDSVLGWPTLHNLKGKKWQNGISMLASMASAAIHELASIQVAHFESVRILNWN